MVLRESVLLYRCYSDTNISRDSLRLQIYKGLGFEPVINERGTMAKMLVRMY